MKAMKGRKEEDAMQSAGVQNQRLHIHTHVVLLGIAVIIWLVDPTNEKLASAGTDLLGKQAWMSAVASLVLGCCAAAGLLHVPPPPPFFFLSQHSHLASPSFCLPYLRPA
jgi:hypothetical protein